MPRQKRPVRPRPSPPWPSPALLLSLPAAWRPESPRTGDDPAEVPKPTEGGRFARIFRCIASRPKRNTAAARADTTAGMGNTPQPAPITILPVGHTAGWPGNTTLAARNTTSTTRNTIPAPRNTTSAMCNAIFPWVLTTFAARVMHVAVRVLRSGFRLTAERRMPAALPGFEDHVPVDEKPVQSAAERSALRPPAERCAGFRAGEPLGQIGKGFAHVCLEMDQKLPGPGASRRRDRLAKS